MRNEVKAIGPVYYATVKAEGAPIVDSGETDVNREWADFNDPACCGPCRNQTSRRLEGV